MDETCRRLIELHRLTDEIEALRRTPGFREWLEKFTRCRFNEAVLLLRNNPPAEVLEIQSRMQRFATIAKMLPPDTLPDYQYPIWYLWLRGWSLTLTQWLWPVVPRRLGRLDGTAGASDGELVPVQIAPEALAPQTETEPSQPHGRIEIELSNGRKLRVDQEVDAQALRRVIAVLEDA